MDQEHLKHLIKKYEAGTASAAERYVVERWYESLLQEGTEMDHFADAIDHKAFQEQLVRRALQSTIPIKRWRPYKWISAAAVMLFLISAIGMLYRYGAGNPKDEDPLMRSHSVSTGVREVKQVTLPDSSVVYLNANSILTIPPDFNHANRDITLMGEAYFEVRKNPQLPFNVHVGQLAIQVLGTTFNIQDYEAIDHISITVESGQVRVSNPAEVLGLLNGRDHLVYDKKSSTASLSTVPSDVRSSWRNGTVVLDGANFDELAQAYYNTYGVHLLSKDLKVRQNHYHFTIRTTRTVDQAMEQLCEMINKRYRKEGNRIHIY
ncbi:FecR family protein [Olivibacter sp. XZL3]|uniref:FecR family protein n=1 Tax=Olivibacter sp. XZL3 TaxID=1735116 RepID=UPI0010667D56|nr:FecR family protein [Olivibacter sp. XZL3]